MPGMSTFYKHPLFNVALDPGGGFGLKKVPPSDNTSDKEALSGFDAAQTFPFNPHLQVR